MSFKDYLNSKETRFFQKIRILIDIRLKRLKQKRNFFKF